MNTLLTTEETCTILKISKAALYKYIRCKEIPAFKFGRRWKFQRDAIAQWIESKINESKVDKNLNG